MKNTRKTTPAASVSVAARHFFDDAATPPCGDAAVMQGGASPGSVNDNRRKKGDVAWRDALLHSTENVEDQHAEEIQVEMK